MVDARLHAQGLHTYLLYGDSARRGLCKGLGFSDEDRHENIGRVAEVAHLMADAGLMVLVCLIYPFQKNRALARELAGLHRFAEIHVDVSLDVAESRDPKGLYKMARRGEVKSFTGIASPYEVPVCPDLRVDTCEYSVSVAADLISNWLEN